MTRSGYRACVRCGNNRKLSRYVGTRGRICDTCRASRSYATSKAQRLEETYGITLDEWNAILAAQAGVCAICKGKRKQYDVDHDHRVERALMEQGVPKPRATRMSIRGLLCKRCNRRLLPAATDSQCILEHAIAYLDDWPSDAVITDLLPAS